MRDTTTPTLADTLDQALRAAGTPTRAAQQQAYLKSALAHYGVPLPALRRIVRTASAARPPAHAELLATVDALWERGVFDLQLAAVELLLDRKALLGPQDVVRLEHLLRTSHTSALVDAIAPLVGVLFARDPALGDTLDRWAVDADFWIRRAAMLALLVPLRSGSGDLARFFRYADAMLEEREFFVRKAIGWILRDTSKRRPDEVFAWLEPRAARASGVTLREAVKYLTADQRTRIAAAAKSRARR